MKPAHGLGLFPVGAVFSYFNYLGTLALGEPVYFFLTWEDEKTVFICAGIVLTLAICFYFLAVSTLHIKRGFNFVKPHTN